MLVEAKRLGYYGHRRRHPGEKFTLNKPEDFSNNWMKRLDAEKPPVAAKRKNSRADGRSTKPAAPEAPPAEEQGDGQEEEQQTDGEKRTNDAEMI